MKTVIAGNDSENDVPGVDDVSSDEKVETAESEKDENDDDEGWNFRKSHQLEYRPPTPPLTPYQAKLSAFEDEKESAVADPSRCCCKRFLLIGAGFLVISVLYSNVSGLRSEVQTQEQRLLRLEQANQLLKGELEKLQESFKPAQEATRVDEQAAEPSNGESFYPAEPLSDPVTKTVWMGNEEEEMVQILDKRHNSLPDYCYFTDEDDLFFDYNREICEQKKRKLELKNKKGEKKKKQRIGDVPRIEIHVDDVWKVETQSYDEYVSETLKSLNDEIQEIKSKRGYAPTHDDVKGKENSAPPPEKSATEKRRSFREKKRSKSNAEWDEKRMIGREEARRLHEKQQQDNLNWYLKRKNERESLRESNGSEA